MHKKLERLQQLLFVAFLLTFPHNLFVQLSDSVGYVNGLRIDYLIPKLYLSQLIAVALVGVWTVASLRNRSKQWSSWLSVHRFLIAAISTLFVVLFTRSLFTSIPVASILFSLQLLILFFVGVWMYSHRWLLQTKVVLQVIFVIFTVQISLATLQFFTQQSLFPYHILGETQIQRQIGIAKVGFPIIETLTSSSLGQRLAPYGTFPHPNVLAGCVTLMGIIIVTHSRNLWIKIWAILCIGWILLLTQSLTALITLVIAMLVFFLDHHQQSYNIPRSIPYQRLLVLSFLVVAVLVPTLLQSLRTNDPSVARRAMLNTAAIQLWQENLLLGVGVNQFTAHVENVSSNQEVVAFSQPAHHIPLLMLAEFGIAGVGLLLLTLWLIMRKKDQSTQYALILAFTILAPILLLDHYPYTLWQGQVMIIVFLLFFQKIYKSN